MLSVNKTDRCQNRSSRQCSQQSARSTLAKSPGFQIQCPLQRELKSVYLAWRCPSTADKMAILVSVESMHLQRRCRVPEYCRGEEGKLIKSSSEPYLPKGPDKYQRASLGKHSLPQECSPGR